MMKFTYETQGAITYLVCELEPAEQIDSLSLGMLTNNHIPGLAPVLYTEMNSQRFLKYNISAKVSSDQFFGGNMNKQRTLQAFFNILSSVCSADEYMIDLSSFSLVPEHIFLNVSSCETAMICVPVITDKDANAEAAALFKRIMFSTKFDNGEDVSYITELITYINGGPAFTVYGMKDLVEKLQSGAAVPRAVTPPSQPAPAADFNATISIDDMPQMMAQTAGGAQPPRPQITQPPVSKPQPAQTVPPQRPVMNNPVPTPSAQGMTPPSKPVGMPQAAPMRPPVPKPQPQAPTNKPPVSNGPGFAIPGQVNIPGKAPAVPTPPPAPKKEKKAKATGDKKMSLFGLMAHYNKDNAELYKQQKKDAKMAKAAEKQQKATSAVNVPGQRPPMGGPGMPPPQPMGQAPYQTPVQPIPVQNSFNETTVLSPMNDGATTLLSAAAGITQPCLIRTKTGERIVINKPVFRIGKEKSYVDYFVADNTAISRSHCNIHTENGEYFIEDTNSTNHTYVNGKIINSNVKVKLISGDRIRLANEDFTFSL
jgi:hypothetical protein